MTQDEQYMSRCLQLALNGELHAAPNPMVGAVILHDGVIIGEGWHRRCGEAHAEVNAVRSVAAENDHLLPESTIYVSLEPCSHWGKTPPCAKLLVEKRFRRVVVGCVDPFAKVQGRGIQMLRDAGIEVTVGVLEKQCKYLNRKFFTMHNLGRPWITLKWAQSADGFIDRKRNSRADGEAVRFSSAWTRMMVHRLRATHQAILVGRRTAELDAPTLTTRYWAGNSPQRIVLGGGMDISAMLSELYSENVQSLLVEGGRQVLQSFIDADLWDEAYVEKTDVKLYDGVAAPVLPMDETTLKGRAVHVNFT
ncbi:MAG: bifunctional diaminohydroxyphosphoribosylaminopyrimidine deaminase/5-amino-6-(5-phosphoribosylamino)uracil reductase RibD [Bacteroidaceae bacterium]|nr:bifunctional diaminohydroxyphosphoribosylaminopyrimidine deaminase/5-amino-6-(5-phosphoribosylamino)uracil reductase RibD [Bacteroidaceae bacterium]